MKYLKSHQISKFIAVLVITFGLASQMAAAQTALNWNNPPKYVTFNAFNNNPVIGNEADFLSARQFTNSAFSRSLEVSAGQEIVLQVYYNNDAGRAGLVAKNSRVQISLPSVAAQSQSINAYISADNAKPTKVVDAVNLVSNSAVKLDYEAGSAKIWNNSLRGAKISDAVVTSGAPIGYTKLDGNIPGGAKYSGYVTIKVRVDAPPVTSSATTSVPNTGPGDVVGIFAGVTLAATAGHWLLSVRRHRQLF